jgi:hypothetical protein
VGAQDRAAIRAPRRPARLENCTQANEVKEKRQDLDPLVPICWHASLRLHSRPINLMVYQGSYFLEGMGEFISRSASRLDAFSGYPIQA